MSNKDTRAVIVPRGEMDVSRANAISFARERLRFLIAKLDEEPNIVAPLLQEERSWAVLIDRDILFADNYRPGDLAVHDSGGVAILVGNSGSRRKAI